uniref:Reverse transcriptase Ty1/copia-type domain-containing protein n=1 Tax=Cannabis sativa TaxID=3483 RepID=A0A803PV91_CANSA
MSSKGYRCLHPSGRIYVARSVTFNEEEFPYSQLFPTKPQSNKPTATVDHGLSPIPQSPHVPTPTHISHVPTSSGSSNELNIPQSPTISSNEAFPHSQHNPPNTSPIPNPPTTADNSNSRQNVSHNNHPMVTHSKLGIYKPKLYLAAQQDISEPKTIKEALANPHWNKAMNNEFGALKKKKTWILVPPTSKMKIIHNKWIFRVKYKKDGSVERHKARLVAKGFQQVPGVDFFETYSSVIKPCTIRIMFTLGVTNGWEIQQLDINNAFLNGDLQEDAPRAWFEKLTTSLKQWGFTNSKSDASFFIKKINNKLLLILVYVDDILVTGEDPMEVQQVISLVHSQYALKVLGPVNYFLSFETVVARSSTESEYRALALATTEIIWIQSLLFELDIKLPQCPILWCDNLGAGSLASNPVFYARTKHIEVDLHFVQDKVIAHQLDVRYVDTSHQLAYIFTKPLPVSSFVYLKDKITHGLTSVS